MIKIASDLLTSKIKNLGSLFGLLLLLMSHSLAYANQTSDIAGSSLGNDFFYTTPEGSQISEVRVRWGYYINAFQFTTKLGGREVLGPVIGDDAGGEVTVYKLAPDEYITRVSGTVNEAEYVKTLVIHTNKRQLKQAGWDLGPTSYDFSVPTGNEFAGFAGRTTEWIRAIGLVSRAPNSSSTTALLPSNSTGLEQTVVNQLGQPILVAQLSADPNEAPQGLIEIAPGQTETFDVPDRASLGFFNNQSQQWVGMSYAVPAGDRPTVVIPHLEPGFAQVAIKNTMPEVVNVFSRASDINAELEAVAQIEPDQSTLAYVAQTHELWFQGANRQDWIAMNYVVPEHLQAAVNVPYIQPGFQLIQINNNHTGTVSVFSWAGTEQDQPIPIGSADAGASLRTYSELGRELWFQDSAQNWIGMSYPMTASSSAVTVPYIAPGYNSLSLSNTLNEPILVYASEVDSQEQPEFVAQIEANANQVVYQKQGRQLWFKTAAVESWLGEAYLINQSNPLALDIPPKVGDRNADGTISDAEVETIANEVIKKMIEDKANVVDKPQACWKGSYGRGIGTIPSSVGGAENCRGKEHTEFVDGLCYRPCKEDYTGFATMCIPGCPAGYRDDGLYCYKPKPIERSAFPWKFGDSLNMNDALARCKKSAEGKASGCGIYNSNTMVYTNCPSGYKTAPLITNLCTPKCPAGTTDIGISCQKHTYDRGVGEIPVLCSDPARPDDDAGLCYAACEAKHTGVGPVCWEDCPEGYVNCGASCAVSDLACGMTIGSQVLEPLMLAGNVAIIGASLGTATGAVAAGNVAKAAATTAAKTAAKVGAKQAAKAAMKAKIKALIKSGTFQAVKEAGKKAGKDLATDLAIGAVLSTGVWAGTAIAGSVNERKRIEERVRQKLAEDVSDEQIDTIINQLYEGAEADDFPYDALDPTGIASLVVAYNLPSCKDVE